MEKAYKRSRVMYIIEAGLEYLIAILFAESFLPRLTGANGLDLSDPVRAVISSVISLGCVFQLIAMLLRRGRAKPLVLSLSIANQLLFMFLYIIPVFNFNGMAKKAIFIVGILLAYLLYYIAHPQKINWFMSLIDDKQRGKFTAKKEIISLVMGIVFSFVMGAIVDKLQENGNHKGAFIVIAVTVFVLMIFHSLTMILSVEKEEKKSNAGVAREFFSTFKNKGVIMVSVVFVLWNIASYSSKPFYGPYMENENELAFSATFLASLSAVSAVSRIIASVIFGIMADKKSFSKTITVAFVIAALSFLTVSFATPENGKVMFVFHYILYGAAMGGINSALINLCYDYAPTSKRVGALAVTQALSGVVGFTTTTVVALLVDKIQANGNKFLGINIYAQQVVSLIGATFAILAMLYVLIFFVIKKSVKREGGK
jgi:predicted MFS family arabinose efflux permease